MRFRSFALLALPIACGGDVASNADAATDAYVAPDTSLVDAAPPPVGQPPLPPTIVTPPSATTMTFVINQVFLGEADRGGAASASAWKSYGYNIDGKVTTKSSTDVCTLASNAGSSVQVDGDNGIDNSWGSNILPIFQNASGLVTPSKTADDAIAKGGNTTELTLTGLSSDPAQSSTGLSASVYATGIYPGTPTFDLSTDWPVAPSEVKDGKTVASGPVHSFPSSYIANGTFVSGTGTFVFNFAMGAVGWPIVVHHAVVTFDHTAPGAATNGTVSGVIDTTEFIAAFKAVAGRISTSLCASSTLDGISAQFMQAQDILLDGTNGPGTPCTGISIGLGFSGVQIANPTMVSNDPTPPDPCK
jgi:hypothetical protein